MKINCIIVDDEPLALDLMERYVSQTPFLNLVARCETAAEVLFNVNIKDVDLIFMDIQMPNLSGIELSRSLDDDIMVIFVTAYDNYAVEGFKVNAVDYLLKPISYQNFLDSASRALKLFELKQKKVCSPNSPMCNFKKQDNYIYVKSGYKVIQVNLNEVLYIEGLKDYVKIHMENQREPIVSIMSIKSLEDLLPAGMFMRVHRSFIVQISKVKMVDRSRIVFNDEFIPISEKYKDAFYNYINSRLLK